MNETAAAVFPWPHLVDTDGSCPECGAEDARTGNCPSHPDYPDTDGMSWGELADLDGITGAWATALVCSQCGTGNYAPEDQPDIGFYQCTEPTCRHQVTSFDFDTDEGETLRAINGRLYVIHPAGVEG